MITRSPGFRSPSTISVKLSSSRPAVTGTGDRLAVAQHPDGRGPAPLDLR